MSTPLALVTGANRGIGLEVARQLARGGWRVLLGCRDGQRGQAAAAELAAGGLQAEVVVLDVADGESIRRAAREVEARFARLDVLVNNAAVHYDDDQRAGSVDLGIAREALETNALGAWATCVAFLPLLRRSRRARIVNVSSEAGSLAGMSGGAPAYSVSKAALNAITRVLAGDLRSEGILVNAVCPGWVATDMGGPGGRPVAEGAAGIVWAATLPDGGPSGGFFRDGRALEW